ncbi:MAG TPA: endopeptidase La [Saprospiraceae bacterium]|nr:endopeptidase La [Saprospiraceae bacterium]MCB9329156.1 endopeptidase La [Lewinellaceae bacterium]HPK09459.1 endopeptidase La [Saprospiraceae bacterium]HPQ20888.1 endopeptidase La [Saprospiraceae bacterium]
MFENIKVEMQRRDEGEMIPMFSVGDDELHFDDDYGNELPILALKNTVLFPGVVIPITVGRDKSLKALKVAEKGNKYLGVLTQKDTSIEDPDIKDLYSSGTIARIIKVLKMPDNSITAILQGRSRFKVDSTIQDEPYLKASFSILQEEDLKKDIEFNATISSIKDTAKRIIELSPQLPPEANLMLQNIKSNGFLLNFISSNVNIPTAKKQELLEMENIKNKANRVLEIINAELQLLEVKEQIESKVRGDIEKQQKEYFLNQQLKTIQEELGGNPQEEELNELAKRADKMKWPVEVKKAFDKEIHKARRINPQIAEYSVTLNYLETLLDLPWEKYTKDNFDLKKVKAILDEDHYGLEDIKKRILEHLAVLKLKGDMKAPILCLVGPPGVGKTSLGKSIAKALKRHFVRMSLGGLHDESEIRGHRKTYIGAMPGRIIQSIKKAKSSNPVFILDEIDKLGKDFRGDPSSALLEVLDPEQNSAFYDNYLELEYDLSKVLFIATANNLSSIQPALLDRMEIIEIAGYSNEEKIEIAKRHLVPKQKQEHGLGAKDVKLTDEVIADIISQYTREAGVRTLDREIAGVMRSTARKKAMDEKYSKTIKSTELNELLGPIKYTNELYIKVDVPGVAVGLAWTRVGGDILFIEASKSPGKGKLTLTGNLGDVMKESATTALSFIKANATALNIEQEVFEKTDLHIHVPEGAIPKDGPSAGVTMLTALCSSLMNKPVKSGLAMTGEITLRGKVLPVGGIKEKVLAAKRAGITDILLCTENKRHVDQINKEYIKDINFIFVDKMSQVLEHALGFVGF